MSEILNYIPTDDDGYTLDAYIAAFPRLHSAVRLKYRPMGWLDRATFFQLVKSGGVSERALQEAVAKAMLKRIISWSIKVKTSDGVLVDAPITLDMIEKLLPSVFTKMSEIIVWGTSGGDADPEESLEEMKAKVNIELEAAIAGTNYANKMSEGLAKN